MKLSSAEKSRTSRNSRRTIRSVDLRIFTVTFRICLRASYLGDVATHFSRRRIASANPQECGFPRYRRGQHRDRCTTEYQTRNKTISNGIFVDCRESSTNRVLEGLAAAVASWQTFRNGILPRGPPTSHSLPSRRVERRKIPRILYVLLLAPGILLGRAKRALALARPFSFDILLAHLHADFRAYTLISELGG